MTYLAYLHTEGSAEVNGERVCLVPNPSPHLPCGWTVACCGWVRQRYISQDLEEAFRLYQLAERLNDSVAMHNLGIFCERGWHEFDTSGKPLGKPDVLKSKDWSVALALGFGLWVLGFGLWVLGFGFWALGFGLWALGVSTLALIVL